MLTCQIDPRKRARSPPIFGLLPVKSRRYKSLLQTAAAFAVAARGLLSKGRGSKRASASRAHRTGPDSRTNLKR
jgi:hypothetical protein